MMSILTPPSSLLPAAFYSYIPHFLSPFSFFFLISLYPYHDSIRIGLVTGPDREMYINTTTRNINTVPGSGSGQVGGDRLAMNTRYRSPSPLSSNHRISTRCESYPGAPLSSDYNDNIDGDEEYTNLCFLLFLSPHFPSPWLLLLPSLSHYTQ